MAATHTVKYCGDLVAVPSLEEIYVYDIVRELYNTQAIINTEHGII